MAATDTFPDTVPSINAPATTGEAVTPSDTAGTGDLTSISRALWVGTGGDLAVVMADGTALTLANVPSGTLLPLRVKRVADTNTTASDIVALS